MKKFSIFLLVFLLFSSVQPSTACTRILSVTKQAVLVGRNMDWLEDMHANLWVYPRGILRTGINSNNPLHWISKYGSIAATAYDSMLPITTDGMNEAGLAAHLLSLPESNYGERNDHVPGLSVLLWAQFYLDNFKSVDEAINFTNNNSFQIIPFYFPKLEKWINLHLALEDSKGDAAVIEYVDGKVHIYHDRSQLVLTNSPTFDKQLLNLKKYRGFGGDQPLPGTTSPEDRFVRATFYIKHLSDADTLQKNIYALLSVLQNISQPFGLPSDERPKISPTLWRTISDLTDRVYYFNATNRFNIFWVQLNNFNLNAGSPTLKLDLDEHANLSGDVSSQFDIVMP